METGTGSGQVKMFEQQGQTVKQSLAGAKTPSRSNTGRHEGRTAGEPQLQSTPLSPALGPTITDMGAEAAAAANSKSNDSKGREGTDGWTSTTGNICNNHQHLNHNHPIPHPPLSSSSSTSALTTTILISNLHCSSCTSTIHSLLGRLSPAPVSVAAEIVTHTVTVVHTRALAPAEIVRVLLEAEFEVDSVRVDGGGLCTEDGVNSTFYVREEDTSATVSGDGGLLGRVRAAMDAGNLTKRRRHIEVCQMCRISETAEGSPDGKGNIDEKKKSNYQTVQVRRLTGLTRSASYDSSGMSSPSYSSRFPSSTTTPVIGAAGVGLYGFKAQRPRLRGRSQSGTAECSGTHLLLCHGCDRATADNVPSGVGGIAAGLDGNDKHQASSNLGGCNGGRQSDLYSTDPSRYLIPRSSFPTATITSATQRPTDFLPERNSGAISLSTASTAYPSIDVRPNIHTTFPGYITAAAESTHPSSRITPLTHKQTSSSRPETHIPDATSPSSSRTTKVHPSSTMAVGDEKVSVLAQELPLGTPMPPTSDPINNPLPYTAITVDSPQSIELYEAVFSIEGMTCAVCTGKVTETIELLPGIKSAEVHLMTNSATVRFEGTRNDVDKIIDEVESVGYGCTLDVLKVVPPQLWEATFSIEGMTCAVCTGRVTETIQALSGVKNVEVALVTNSATVRFTGKKEDVEKIVDEVESVGYGCTLDVIKEVGSDNGEGLKVQERSVMIKVEGMFCESCPARILEALNTMDSVVMVEKPLTVADPIMELAYLPAPPAFTIRHIISTIEKLNPAFSVSVYHPPTIEERSRRIQRRELQKLMIRLVACFIIAIPSFLIGIVWMSLVPRSDKLRQYWETPIWAGEAQRLEWALLFLATPVQFFIADVFHKRAIKEIRSLWRKGSTVPILRRFYRFGSMNLLISLGVSIAYFASIALLAMAATRERGDHSGGHSTSYFDSTIFLTLFLLIGKCLEAYSKAKTVDAVSMLGKLRPTEALLLLKEATSPQSDSEFGSGRNSIDEKAVDKTQIGGQPAVKKVSIDLLEVGDTIVVQHGGSPPADGKIVSGETKFDESSLTGEARPVAKNAGDEVYAGTINRGKAVHVLVSAVDGESMLDKIVKVVREGQTRRAPIERVADVITGYFVPVVTLIAIATWVIWLSLGLSGTLPEYWRDTEQGGWIVWSLGFAIACFVVACPCGIGLAAPTALFVGSGLAAKHGILAKGGGEAFQEASWLDCIVFDKTGTLTQGGEPKVTDEKIFLAAEAADAEKAAALDAHLRQLVYAVATGLEDMSSHPLARAVVSFCEPREKAVVVSADIEEIPGRGLKGTFTLPSSECSFEAIIGNEAFMTESGVAELEQSTRDTLHSWKSAAKSVILLAIKLRSGTSSLPFTSEGYLLAAAFAASDPLRPEASYVVKHLRQAGISVWMISGDNPVTAVAVAKTVGIPQENVIAGVLPTQKAEKVQWLQDNAPKRPRGNFITKLFKNKENTNPRAVVAMVGDGINDAPALAVSDVGVAIGSGSDIAIGSAKFILVSSNLTSLLTLTELSRAVFRRVKFNFFWACIYNMIALPVAAGILYPVGFQGYVWHPEEHGIHNAEPQRIRLEPVWAALAMALSSVSVVCSSLMLRTRWYGVGFRARRFEASEEAVTLDSVKGGEKAAKMV